MLSVSNQRQTQSSREYKEVQGDSSKTSSSSSQTKRQSPFDAQSKIMSFKGISQQAGSSQQTSGKTETSGDTASSSSSGCKGNSSRETTNSDGENSQNTTASSGENQDTQAYGSQASTDSDTSTSETDDSTATDESSVASSQTSGSTATTASTGETIVVSEPIVVDGGVFDGEGKTYTASSSLGDGSQSEDQQPIFILKNGATLKNVTIGDNGADGIHVYGGATLENVNWTDVGEDALTVKSEGDVNIIGGSAANASDKIFQVNADTNLTITNFKADGFTTLVRTNGGKQIDANVTIDGGEFSNGTVLFRTDSDSASVTFTGDITASNVTYRTRYKDQKESYS